MISAESELTETDRLRNPGRSLWHNHLNPGRMCLGATTDIAGVAFFKHCFRREINHTCRAVQQVKDCPESINRYALVPAARLPRWSHLSGIC